MENNEILGFQFEPTKVLLPDSSSAEVGKLVHQQIVKEAVLGETKYQLILGGCVSMKGCLCYHELTACKYFKIKRFYVYLLSILQIFIIKLINKEVVINLIHNTKRQSFLPIFFILRN